ncbi:MCE family protein [Actinomycetospora endophytica]|uniref:MCE family protein n=1 Tax=Actinomycetospora endophytica TaxID=2291215 RepID=A0ABS8P2T9_9PSEU|nr:MCE family protein [Actinomycetospora endophytica]MCD2192565.1 MCE family protein [Actinomycetospora endophytica]
MTAPAKDLRPPLSSTRRRMYGLALLLIMVLVVTVCLLNFNKVFKSVDIVTLQTDTVGNQLSKQGDVKIRGVIVGEIKSVESDGQKATIQMAMDPDALSAIPSNVTAMLIPKTLFGERYVSLTVPPNPTARRLADGDFISEDRSQNATETEQVLNNLLPVLTAVQPQKLSDTLGAISQALSGRGEQFGNTLVQLNQYLEGVNPSLPDLTAVINRLSPTADIYNAASPDLIGALDNLVTTSRTLVQQRAAFESTFRSVTSASNVTTDFLAANRDNIINLAATSRPVLDLLARYSPEFPCLLQQLTDLTPKINDVLKPTTGIQIAAELTIDRGKYTPADSPAYQDKRGPRCYIINGQAPQYPPGGPFADGSAAPPASRATTQGYAANGGAAATDQQSTPTNSNAAQRGANSQNPGSSGTSTQTDTGTGSQTQGQGAGKIDAANLGLPNTPNSPEERSLVTTLTGMQMGVPASQVPSFAPYLTAATMRGTTVAIS